MSTESPLAFDSAVSRAIPWAALLDELVRRHGVHTVLLYGSHARGDATPHSDVDVIAVRATGPDARDLGTWNGLALDVHLVRDEGIATLVAKRASALRDARVLRQRARLGEEILAGVRARLSGPPDAQPPGELAALWAWGDKMRGRVASTDPVLAALHRATLIVESLPAWAEVRRRWYFGGKAALRALPTEDPVMYAAWVEASRPGAEVAAFLRLLDAVFDERFGRPPSSGPVGDVPA